MRVIQSSKGTPDQFLNALQSRIDELGGVGSSTNIGSNRRVVKAGKQDYLYAIGDEIIYDGNYYGVKPMLVKAKIIQFGGGMSSHGNIFHGYTVRKDSGRELPVSEERIIGLASDVSVTSSTTVKAAQTVFADMGVQLDSDLDQQIRDLFSSGDTDRIIRFIHKCLPPDEFAAFKKRLLITSSTDVKSSSVMSAMVTDYIDSDTLHKLVSYNRNFGSFNHYRQLDGMRLVTTKVDRYDNIGPHGAVNNTDRYWQVVEKPSSESPGDGTFEVYEIDADGEKIGDAFPLDSSVNSATNIECAFDTGIFPSTIEDLIQLAEQHSLEYDYDDAGNLVVWETYTDPATTSGDNKITENLQSFFDAANANPNFSYEDYDGEYGVGFNGIRGVKNIQAATDPFIEYLSELGSVIEEELYEQTYKARSRVSGNNLIIDVFEGHLGAEDGEPIDTFTISDISLAGGNITIEQEGQRLAKQIAEAVSSDCVESSTDIMAASLDNDSSYINDLCEQTIASLTDKGYNGGYQIQPDKNYIYFELFESADSDDVIATYLQPIDDITPVPEDLLDDADMLADAIIDSVSSEDVDASVTASDEGGEYTYPVAQWQDTDTIVQYKGFTSISWAESDEDSGWCIQDNNGKNIDMGAFGLIDQVGNTNYDPFDEASIKQAIDELVTNGYRLEDDFDMGRDHYGTTEFM